MIKLLCADINAIKLAATVDNLIPFFFHCEWYGIW